MSVQIRKIDDRDPSVHRSPGDWSDGGNGLEYMGTTTRTNRLGASLTIPFTGTKILIFGTVDYLGAGQTPTSLFSVDGGRATQYTGRQLADDQNYAQKFYESDELPYGDHVMLVTISNAPSITASFTFDWAEIYDPGLPAQSSSSTMVPPSTSVNRPTTTTSNPPPPQTSNSSSRQLSESSTSSPSASSVSSTSISSTGSLSGSLSQSSELFSSPTTTPLSNPTSNSTSIDSAQDMTGDQSTSASGSHKSSTPAVIGGVVGGLVVIILVLLGIIICLRRRRHSSTRPGDSILTSGKSMNPPSTQATRGGTEVTPFITGPRSSGQFTATGSDRFGLSRPNAMSDYQASNPDTTSQSVTSPSSSQDTRFMVFNATGMPASYGFTKQEQAQQDRYQRRREEIEAPPPSYDDPF